MSDSGSSSSHAAAAAPAQNHFGANQTHVVTRTAAPLGDKPKSEGKKSFMASNAVVRPPRSYSADREAQQMRHVATVLRTDKKVADGQEVQLTHSPPDADGKPRPLTLSTNTNAGNARLREIFKDGKTLREGVDEVLAAAAPTTGTDGTTETAGLKAREQRHKQKVGRDHGFEPMDMAPTIPANVPKAQDGLHAERRNDQHLSANGVDTSQTFSKGTKRRCAHCYESLKHTQQSPADGGPGPAWQSQAASRGNATASEQLTRTTQLRNGAHTWDVDSDSDSDADTPTTGTATRAGHAAPGFTAFGSTSPSTSHSTTTGGGSSHTASAPATATGRSPAQFGALMPPPQSSRTSTASAAQKRRNHAAAREPAEGTSRSKRARSASSTP